MGDAAHPVPVEEGREDSPPSAVVTFPGALRRQSQPPPLRLEVEESAEGMSPRNMWQVYAFAGFLVARWMWARWREKKGRGGGGGSSGADAAAAST